MNPLLFQTNILQGDSMPNPHIIRNLIAGCPRVLSNVESLYQLFVARSDGPLCQLIHGHKCSRKRTNRPGSVCS